MLTQKRRLYYLLIFLILLSACSFYDKDSMNLRLDVENPDLDRIALKKVNAREKVFIDSIFKKQWVNGKKIKVNEQGNYFLSINNLSGIPVYMEPGFNIKICITRVNRFYYEGRGSEENNYQLMCDNHPVGLGFKGYKLNPKGFLEYLDKQMQPFFEIINDNDLKKEFWKKAKSDQILIKLTAILRYPEEYMKYYKKEVQLPSNYRDVLKIYDLNDKSLYGGNQQLVDEFFKYYVAYLFNNEIRDTSALSTEDRILKNFELLYTRFKDKEVRDKVMYLYAMQIVGTYKSSEIEKGMDFYFEHSRKEK